MAKKQISKKENIVQPIIREEGKEHVLEKMFQGKQALMPTLKSVGYAPLEDGSWVSFVITTKGTEVLLIEVDDPNTHAIAEESAKISFATQLMSQGI